MYVRLTAALALACLVSLVPRNAFAGQEAHQTGSDIRVQVERNGTASIELCLRWRVVRGPLHSVDVVNVDPEAVIDPEVRVTEEDGRELVGHAERRDDRAARISIDDPHALLRGNVTLRVRLHEDLAAAQALARDGARWRLAWSAPVAADGFEGARTVFEIPEAPDPPQPIIAETGLVDEAALATLRREPGRDVLELVRPHVARGEAVAWTVQFDPRGMTHVADPRLRPATDRKPPPEPSRIREASLSAVLLALAVAFGLLVAHKTNAFRLACDERNARLRSLLPLPDVLRAALAGGALSGAVGLEFAGAPTAAAGCIALSILGAALRAPLARPVTRGPGRWLALRPEDAFAPAASAAHWLDFDTGVGRATALITVLLVAAGAAVAARFDPIGPWLVVLDAAPLFAVLATGMRSQLPPHAARSAVSWMEASFRRLRPHDSLRVTPWARVAERPPGPDELRLLVLPRAAMPGLIGVEIGLSWCSTPVGWTARPQVLARVADGTPAAVKLAIELPGVRLAPGLRSDERVAVLNPRSPSRAGGVALARALAAVLTDRRVAQPPRGWNALERRHIPQARAA
jgi:hypothetical protein